jgi:hypothetical protein
MRFDRRGRAGIEHAQTRANSQSIKGRAQFSVPLPSLGAQRLKAIVPTTKEMVAMIVSTIP